MNTLQALFVALFVVGFVACSSPTDTENTQEKEEFEQYVAGNFLVTSPTSAEYQGTSQAKADTVILEQTGKRKLELLKDEYVDNEKPSVKFSVSFTDSTITRQDSIKFKDIIIRTNKKTDHLFLGRRTELRLSDDRFYADIGGAYICERSLPSGLNIELNIVKDEGLYRKYIVQSSGIEEVFDEFCVE